MDGRTDINKYYNGCSKLINALVLPHGGFTKRPGTEYIATAANRANLIPFEFSVDDTLVLEFSNLLTRFYKDQDIVNGNVGTEDLSGVDDGALVAHWLLNESEGVTVVNDDNAGTYDGTATVDCGTLNATGKVGSGCFDLDGQYTVEIADAAVFSFTDNSDDSAFSLACWANVTTKGGLQVLLSKWRDASTTSEWRFSLTNDRKLQLHLADTSTTLESNRVAQWFLNDNAANTAVDDAVAFVPHDGVATANTSTLNATGQINDCFDFDGQYAVEVADHAALSFDDSGDNPFSLAAWIYVTADASYQRIISKRNTTTDREWSFHLTDSQKLRLLLTDETNNVDVYLTSNDALSNGWHFVVGTYNSVGGATAANGMTLYADNVALDATAVNHASYVQMRAGDTKVVIGAQYTGGVLSHYFVDKIDHVTLFDIELTPSNVSTLWNDGNGLETTVATIISIVSDDAFPIGWHFFGCTYSAPADETTAADGVILYVDGIAVDSTAANDADYTAMQNGAEEVRIGSQRNSGDTANENFWEDEIDEVSVFSDVLTPTEVASLISTAPYSIVSPYTSAEAFEIHVTQSADVMYIAHEDHHPKKLSRFDDLDWTIEDVDFTGGPFLDENITAASLVGFARLGGTARSEYYFPTGATGTLTASGTGNQPFNSNMVGAL